MDFKLNKSNLNFRVYTAATLPDAAQENDICIVSDVPMKNWILSPDAPSGAPRTDGDVWIQYSVTGNTVNIAKTGAMMVVTISASQYVDGVWVYRTAKSHRDGEWVSWVIYLYNSGDQCTAITGGWERKAYGGTAGSVTLNSDNITIVSSDSSVCAGAKDFDTNRISGYKTMKCIVSFTRSSTDGLARFGVSSTYSLGSSGIDSKWITQQIVQTGTQDAEMSLDISAVASGYPMLLAFHGTAVFKKVWFE